MSVHVQTQAPAAQQGCKTLTAVCLNIKNIKQSTER